MSHDIVPGLATVATASGQTGLAATGPPGDAGLSALFASLLAGSGGPPAKIGVIPGAQVQSPATRLATVQEPNGKRSPKAAPGSFPAFPPPALPIKLSPGIDPAPGQMRPTTPPTAAGTAETQNAMDTGPVSGPRTKSETKPGGELPLPETRTSPSVALPAPPVLLIAAPPAPAIVIPAAPAAASPEPGPSRPVTSAMTGLAGPASAVASSARPPILSVLAVQAPPSASAVPTPALVAPVLGEAALAPSALPQTFTLPVGVKPLVPGAASTEAPGQPLSILVRPAADVADGPSEKAAPLVVTQSASFEEPHTLTESALTVPFKAISVSPTADVQTLQVKPVAEIATETVLSGEPARVSALPSLTATRLTPGEAPAASLPPLKTAGIAGKTQEGMDVPAPVVISLSADPPTLMLPAARPSAQSTKAGADTKAAEDGETPGGPPSLAEMPVTAAKISLKTGTAPADNNTRSQPAATANNGTVPTASGSDAKMAERRVSETGKDDGPQEAASPVPAPPIAQATTTLAATVSPTPLTRADRTEVIRQVADAVGTMPPPVRPGTPSQMTLQLHPKDWGQLQISVRITPAVHPDAASPQSVTAHVVAGSAGIKAALESGSSDLRHALRQAGLHLDKFTVTVQAPEAGAKSGTASGGGHHLMNGGGAQPQPDGRPGGGDSPPSGTASFASFTGSPHGGRQEGQAPAPQAMPSRAGEPGEEPTPEPSAPRRAASGQVDMRA